MTTLEKTVVQLVKRLEALECGGKTTASATTSTSALPSKPEPMEEDDDDDEVDLFGSDDEEVCFQSVVFSSFLKGPLMFSQA